MKSKFIKIIFLLCAIFPYFKSFAQDGKALIDLGRDEKLQYSFYNKNHGLWVLVQGGAFVGQVPNCKVYKYSPDLSKKEWAVDMKGVEPKALFDAKHPNYIYFRSAATPARQLIPQKIRFYQLDPTGNVRICEVQKEKEATADRNTAIFTSMNHFCELWTKKKSDYSEFVLVMRHNETLQKTVKTIKMPGIERGKFYSLWFFSSVRDSLLTFVSYETMKSDVTTKSRVVVVNMATCEVIKDFYHTPTLETGGGEWSITYRDHETPQSISYEDNNYYKGLASYFSSRVNVQLAKDGKSFHHYGVVFKKKPNKYYFVWTTLDFDGQQTLQSEFPMELTEEQKTRTFFNFFLEETDEQQIKLELLLPSEKQSDMITVLFDKDGKQLQDCKKSNFQQYRFMQNSKTVVKSPSDIYTCFIKHGKRVTDYIVEKNFKASYGMVSDNGHHILLVSMTKDPALGLVYFKD